MNGSMVLDQLATGFDRTVVTDILNSDPGFPDTTRGISMVLIAIYLFASVLLHGGWLANIRKQNFNLYSFLTDGAKHFFPFFGVALISIVLVLGFGGIIGITFSNIVGDPLATFSSEKPYVIWIIALICVFILWSIVIWSWSVASRLHCISGSSFFQSMIKGLKTLGSNFFKFIAVGLLLVGIHVLLSFIYYWMMGDRGASSWLVVLFAVVIKQSFALIRVALRGFAYNLVDDITFDHTVTK